jgi:hypothetical protein
MINIIKENKEYSLIVFLLALSIVHNFISIEYFRIFYRDDVWTASYAYNFYKTGINFDVIAREVGMILAHGSFVDYLYGFFMNLFPDNHLTHRYVSFGLGLYLLLILNKVFSFFINDKLIVLRTILFISLLEYFVLSSHISRAEMLGASVVFTAFYIFIKDNKIVNYILGSFLLGLAFDIHLASLIGVFLFFGYEIASKRFSFKNYKLYTLTILIFLVGTSVWIFTHYNEIDKVIDGYSLLQSAVIEANFLDRFTFLYDIGMKSRFYRHFIFLIIFVLSTILFFILKSKLDKKIINLYYIFIISFIGYMLLGRTSIFYLLYFFPILYLFFICVLHKIKFGKYIYYAFILYHLAFWSMVYKKEHTANFANYSKNIEKVCNKYINNTTLIIAPDDIWYMYRNNKFLSYNARVKFQDIIRNRNNILLIVNEPLNVYLKLGKKMGQSTGVVAFDLKTLDNFKLVGKVKDYHYGSFGLKKKNIVNIYYKSN